MGLHDGRLSTYVEVVNYLQTTYATDDIIAKAIKELESYEQAPGLFAALYAKIVYTKTLRCGIVCEREKIKSSIYEGLYNSICDNMRVCLGQNPRAPLTELTCYPDTLIKLYKQEREDMRIVQIKVGPIDSEV